MPWKRPDKTLSNEGLNDLNVFTFHIHDVGLDSVYRAPYHEKVFFVRGLKSAHISLLTLPDPIPNIADLSPVRILRKFSGVTSHPT